MSFMWEKNTTPQGKMNYQGDAREDQHSNFLLNTIVLSHDGAWVTALKL